MHKINKIKDFAYEVNFLSLPLIQGLIWSTVFGTVRVLSIDQIWLEYLIPYNCKLFVLRMVTWGYKYLLRYIIISYLQPCNWNGYHFSM